MLQRLVRELGVLEGESRPLEGGITSRNFSARLRGRDHVIRVPGNDAGLLEIDRAAERIAYAYLPPEHAEPGTAFDVEIFGSWVDGEVAKEPLFDPTGERIRA